MSEDRAGWARVLAAFDELVALDPQARAARLGTVAATDPQLGRSLAALLAADGAADTRLSGVEAALEAFWQRQADSGSDPLALVGRTVSHFEITGLLAHGGMGVVYRATDTRLGRAVALKFPLAGTLVAPSVRARFLAEARLAAALDHPNICAIHAAGETEEGQPYIAMPLYPGETLRERIAREGALPVATALDIAMQVARGLDAAHAAGIVHRDLKPANVMLLPGGSVKLLDFGLAKSQDLQLTAATVRLGTASYMSPEQVLGRELDGRTDLWSLGVLLYEMLTGRRPFTGENDIAIAYAIVHREAAAPSGVRAEVPRRTDEVVCALLRADPEARPASAGDVLRMLQGASRPGAPRPRMLSVRFRGTTPRLRAGIAITLLGVLAVVATGWLTGLDDEPPLPTVAIRALTAADGDTAVDALAAGLADAIAIELSRLSGLVVSGPGPEAVDTGVARAFLVDAGATPALLGGRVSRRGAHLRLELHLADARTGARTRSVSLEAPEDRPHQLVDAALAEIVRALRVRLTTAERVRLASATTPVPQAYARYLQALAAERTGSRLGLTVRMPDEALRGAQSLYAQARDADPGFARARARLALMMMRAADSYDTTATRRDHARLEAEAALRLQPGLWEAHEALSNYFLWDFLDIGRAMEEAGRVLAASPNDAHLHAGAGRLHRALGEWELAIAAIERALRLDPGEPRAAFDAATTYERLRRAADAIRQYDRVVALLPDDPTPRVHRGLAYLRLTGQADTLLAVLRRIPRAWDPEGFVTAARFQALWTQRRHEAALAALDSSSVRAFRGDYVFTPVALMRARLYESLDDGMRAGQEYEAARVMLADTLARYPDAPGLRIQHALALAGLGHDQAARAETRRTIDQLQLAGFTPASQADLASAAEVFARTGDADRALALIEQLLTMPAGRDLTVPFLRAWPGYDPLRADPRFEALLARFAAVPP